MGKGPGAEGPGGFRGLEAGHVCVAVSPGEQEEAREVGKSQTVFSDVGFYPKARGGPWKMSRWGWRGGE